MIYCNILRIYWEYGYVNIIRFVQLISRWVILYMRKLSVYPELRLEENNCTCLC